MFIQFCETCDNEMYIKWHDNDTNGDDEEEDSQETYKKYMILYCKKCGNTEKLTRDDFVDENKEPEENSGKFSPLIYKKNYENETIDSRLFNNEFITADRTLPFVKDHKIKCPNCIDKHTDIIYQIYDHDNMKFLYTCTDCKTSWTIN